MGGERHFSAACLTPPLPLPALELQLQFLEYRPGATPSGGILKYFSVVFRIISHHLQGFFSFSRAPSTTV